MHIRVFESGSMEPLHEFESELVPEVGDILALDLNLAHRQFCQVVSRMLRVDLTAKPGDEAVYYLTLEVKDPDGSSWLPRVLDVM